MVYKRVPLGKFDIKTSFAPMEDMGFFIDRHLAPFNNTAQDFDINNAWWMIEHARLSYVKDQEKVTSILNEVGYENVRFIWDDKSGTKVYVAWNSESAVISFTGTEPDGGSKDFIVDLDFLPLKSGRGGLVHGGFKKAFDSIWNRLQELMNEIDVNSVWITGHSLGGALATHCANRMYANGCYTFGSPRVGSKKFNKSILTPIYRVAKSNDIVTRVPTPPVYIHSGDLHFITDEQTILKNPSCIRMFKERLGGSELKILWLLIKLFVFKSSIDFVLGYFHGHSPYNYSVFLWNNLDK